MQLKMNRFQASLSHFLLSLSLFSLVIFMMLYFWYPNPHFTASGGWQGLKIVAGVDLILGPLLTLIVVTKGKAIKLLVMDLSVIGLMQLCALSWGVFTIYQQRPVALVYWENTFMSVPAEVFTAQGVNVEEFEAFGMSFPVLIYAEKPVALEDVARMLNFNENDQIPPHHQVELYRSLQENFSRIESQQVNIDVIISNNAKMKADLDAILEEGNKQIDDYQYYSLRAKYLNLIMLFSQAGELENYILVPLRP